MSARLTIDVWSDYVCPFCYLEMPVLDALKAEFGEDLEIRWRAFELRPDPLPTLDPRGEYLRTTWANAVYPMAEARGMELRLPPVQPRSRLAFEAERFARAEGFGEKMHRALFQAFFESGRNIGKIDVLGDIARALGMNAARLSAALENHDHADAVLADRQEAERLGISGVPTMLIRRSDDPALRPRLVSGAQPVEALHEALEEMLALN